MSLNFRAKNNSQTSGPELLTMRLPTGPLNLINLSMMVGFGFWIRILNNVDSFLLTGSLLWLLRSYRFIIIRITLKTNLMADSYLRNDLVPEGKMSRRDFLKFMGVTGGAIILESLFRTDSVAGTDVRTPEN